MNLLIRYASLEHSDNLYLDYYNSGKNISHKPLSRQGMKECKTFKPNFVPKEIWITPTISALQTAKLINKNFDVPIKERALLRNIPHDLTKLLSQEEMLTPKGLENLRSIFFKNLFENELEENIELIRLRMEKLKQLLDKNEDILVITHGIFLVVFKIYCIEGLKRYENVIKLVDFKQAFYSSLAGYTYPSFKNFNS